jgi:hypothetical protein
MSTTHLKSPFKCPGGVVWWYRLRLPPRRLDPRVVRSNLAWA